MSYYSNVYKGVLSSIVPIKESVVGGGVAQYGSWKFYKKDGFFIADCRDEIEKFKTFEELDMWVTENIKSRY